MSTFVVVRACYLEFRVAFESMYVMVIFCISKTTGTQWLSPTWTTTTAWAIFKMFTFFVQRFTFL